MNNEHEYKRELWILFDLRGLIMHSFYRGKDLEAEENEVATPGHTLSNFSEAYLAPALDIVPASHIIAVEDKGNNYRKKLTTDYKAHRKPLDEPIKESLEKSSDSVKELLKSLGVAQVSCPKTEADDVIALLVEKLPGKKLVYTVDGDLIALSSSDTTVYLKGEPKELFQDKVKPEHLTLYKSLVGDTSDGYKGVYRFGKKSWEKLLDEYKEEGIAELIDIAESKNYLKLKKVLDTEPDKHPLLQQILDNKEQWRVSYEVAKLHPELIDSKQDGEFTRLQWVKRVPSLERLQKLTERINAQYLVDDYKEYLPNQILITAKDWDDELFTQAKRIFEESEFIALDWETWAEPSEGMVEAGGKNFVDMFGSHIAGMGIACGRNLEYNFYFSFDHSDTENNGHKSNIPKLLNLIPRDVPVVAQNFYFEQSVSLVDLGYELPNLHDTKVMAAHVDESSSKGLKDLSKRYLNFSQIKYADVIEKGKTMRDYSAQHVFQYGVDDAIVTAHLYSLFRAILIIEESWEFVRDCEFPAVEMMSKAFVDGASVDFDEVERQSSEDKKTFEECMTTLRKSLKENVSGYSEYWLEELQINHEADTQLIKRELDNYQSMEELKKSKLIKLLEDTECSFEEAKNEILEARQRQYIALITQAKKDAVYEDLVITYQQAKYQFGDRCNTKLLEAVKNNSDKVILVKALIRKVEKIKTGKSTSQPYKLLSSLFIENIEGKKVMEGTELNINSPIQNQKLFYAMLGLPIRLRSFDVSESRAKKGLEGTPQTNEEAIHAAISAGDAPEGSWKRIALDALLKAKKADTRIKLFYNKLPLWKHPKDGMIHPQFNTVGTETHRPTGSSPNLLQLSKKGEGVKIRKCFVPNEKKGHDLIVSIDWDGEELRLMAGLSGDEQLTECYVGENKKNVHSITAAGIAGLSYEEFVAIHQDPNHPDHKKMDNIRKDAKGVNFLSAYGGGAAKLSRALLCDEDTARRYLETKRQTYSGYEQWKEEQIENLMKTGYVKTLYGSRKHLFNKLHDSDDGLVSYYKRAAGNFMIQGLAADYLKKVLADIHKSKTLEKYDASLIAPIYDELVLSCHSYNADELIMEVYKIMVQGIPNMPNPIPMLACPALGINFAEQHEVLIDANQTLTKELINKTINKTINPSSDNLC